jgi:5-methylcytosine-specific restriction endonuclease McrA
VGEAEALAGAAAPLKPPVARAKGGLGMRGARHGCLEDSSPVAPDGFVFDESQARRRISEGVVLAGLRRYARVRRGERVTFNGFNAWRGRPFSADVVLARYGTWRAGLKRAGVEAFHKPYQMSAAELMERLESVWRRCGKPPSVSDLGRERISAGPYDRVWGSLPAARGLLARWKRGEISRGELLRPRRRKRKGRKGVPAGLRWEVFERDGFRCVKCGRGMHSEPPVEIEADHIKPESKGGKTVKGNLQTLCICCNRGKGARGEVRGCRVPPARAERPTSEA